MARECAFSKGAGGIATEYQRFFRTANTGPIGKSVLGRGAIFQLEFVRRI